VYLVDLMVDRKVGDLALNSVDCSVRKLVVWLVATMVWKTVEQMAD
jgi:hypothetical protein